MDQEQIQEYLRRFNQTFSLLKNDNKNSVWCIDLSEDGLRKYQQKFADRMLRDGSTEKEVFSSGALILYGYRMGAVRLKEKNECVTRQGGYMDNAILWYNLDEILDRETEDDNPTAGVSNIIEWIINPGSNIDVAEEVIGKMIVPQVKNLCKIVPPGKRNECTVVMPPVSKEIEIQDWADIFIGVKARDLQINLVNYGHLLNMDDDERQYILQYQTDGYREFVIVSSYEVIRGHNTCLGCLAFDVNDSDHQYILQDIKSVSFVVDNRQEQYEKKEKTEKQNDWEYLTCKYPVNSGVSSFLGNHAASFGRELYKLSGVADASHADAAEVKAVFHENEALQITEVCARLSGEQNLYNIALGDLVYVANILQRSKAFKTVSIGTAKNYKLGTYKQFAALADANKLPEIPSNFNSISWCLKDKRRKLIPYFSLDAKKHSKNQIIESVVNYYDHCTAEMVADELLYMFKNGEDPSAFFVVKVFMYMSQMDSLEIESRNEIITGIENVDDVVYQEIDKSHFQDSKKGKNDKQSRIYKEVLRMSIAELDLTDRTYNCLNHAGIHTLGDVVMRSQADLLKIRNLGKTSLKEIVDKIHLAGLTMVGE